MPVIDISDLNAQTKPMDAIDSILDDYDGGFMKAYEALAVIRAVVCEWKY